MANAAQNVWAKPASVSPRTTRAISGARALAADLEHMPIGVLYQNEEVRCYEDLRRSDVERNPERIGALIEQELDAFAVDRAV